ncbi:MAG TPA: discoidin domain-containing protein [Thermoanaerobaculia bacterium]|nr:discoidin domain-containing protein [Thermoanaerobaculia bacterium]
MTDSEDRREFLHRIVPTAAVLMLLAHAVLGAVEAVIDTAAPVASFDPREAVGATVDAHERGQTPGIFSPDNVEAMLSAGFQPISYRLATELCGEAWHWNPRGTFSDPTENEGYWISSSVIEAPIERSFGYRLPRRGNTIDQMHDDSWSRIDDGDRSTFWKSSPYLDDRPQWLVVDLAKRRTVTAIDIQWADPYAVDFVIQYWTGPDAIDEPADGQWSDFRKGRVIGARGGRTRVRLGDHQARHIRILMVRSSHTSTRISTDARDRAGFAVTEVSVFDEYQHDLVRHAAARRSQSIIWVSSTDPWHRAIDIDTTLEQPGLDLIVRSGLTRSLPPLLPVAVLYGTPEDAAAEVCYLRARDYGVRQFEIGEEPDGQMMSPEDYSYLFLKWSEALQAADPDVLTGGPSLQSTVDSVDHWPDEQGETAWMGRFIRALRARDRLRDFSFFSFEWYPFDNLCTSTAPQLSEAPGILRRVLGRWRAEGVPQTIPWYATEYGYSSYAGRPDVDMEAALFNTEFVAQFLSSGGSAAYFYGLEPDVLIHELLCPTYGNLMLFLSDDDHHIRYALAAYHAARLLNDVWLEGSGRHELYAVSGGSRELSLFAVRRPDRTWALLIINKGSHDAVIHARFGSTPLVDFTVDQFSRQDYRWRARGENGYPDPDHAPRQFHARDIIRAPAHSISVIRRIEN